jgi:DNA (cytosine-5)-methyltransferase 1
LGSDYSFSGYSGQVDLLAAGVPCQPFSLGGKHLGKDDPRNMFPVAIKAVRQIQPKAILFENVRGLLRTGFREYFDYIIAQLHSPTMTIRAGETWRDHFRRLKSSRNHSLTYHVSHQDVDAADYGVPQRRKRVFIVATRSDVGSTWSRLPALRSRTALQLAKDNGTYWKEHELRAGAGQRNAKSEPPSAKRWLTVRDALRGLPEPNGSTQWGIPDDHIAIPGARSYKGHTGSDWDDPAKTIKAGVHGVPGGENTLRLGDDQVRYFTPREVARLQSFPDTYRFCGPWGEVMRQLGNAVPVQLGELFARQIRDQLL